jgi:hypothetical protein
VNINTPQGLYLKSGLGLKLPEIFLAREDFK